MKPLIVYFSSPTLNTHRFVEKLGIRAIRIPISSKKPMEVVDGPFVLISPTYSDDDGSNAVPKPVIRFLNNEYNRDNMVGVIGSGNRNFGDTFALGGRIIAKKCDVPLLYRFELSGTDIDVMNVKRGVEKLWVSLKEQDLKKQTIAS
ncbi:MAG: class Ib ribonucleoside-diphosphate reductase assembly flavoprotein NrdI [Pseudomonadota bacterium]